MLNDCLNYSTTKNYQYLVNFDQPVPAFLDSLSSKVKLQGAEDKRMVFYGTLNNYWKFFLNDWT